MTEEPKRLLIREVTGCFNCPCNMVTDYHAGLVTFCPEAGVSKTEWYEWQQLYCDRKLDDRYENLPVFHPKCPLPKVTADPEE